MMVPRPKSTIMVPPWYHHEVPPFLLSQKQQQNDNPTVVGSIMATASFGCLFAMKSQMDFLILSNFKVWSNFKV